MHEAYIKINKADMALIYRANGHADYAERGKDIVCAGCSLIAGGLAETLTAAYQSGWIGDTVIVDINADGTEVSCLCDDEDVFGELAGRFLFAITQYRLLAENYPDHVKFKAEIRT